MLNVTIVGYTATNGRTGKACLICLHGKEFDSLKSAHGKIPYGKLKLQGKLFWVPYK